MKKLWASKLLLTLSDALFQLHSLSVYDSKIDFLSRTLHLVRPWCFGNIAYSGRRQERMICVGTLIICMCVCVFAQRSPFVCAARLLCLLYFGFLVTDKQRCNETRTAWYKVGSQLPKWTFKCSHSHSQVICITLKRGKNKTITTNQQKCLAVRKSFMFVDVNLTLPTRLFSIDTQIVRLKCPPWPLVPAGNSFTDLAPRHHGPADLG